MFEDDTLKRCPKCGETKPTDAFSKCSNRKDGYQAYCKTCRSADYAANREAISARRHAYYVANAEKICERVRAYQATHTEAKRAYNRAYIAATREERKAYKEANKEHITSYMHNYRETKVEELRAYAREWGRKHPDKVRIRCAKRRALIKNNGGEFSYDDYKAMKTAQAGICAYCQRQHHPDALTIDHIIPLKQGGRHEAANICLACRKCNFSKGNRTPEQWINRWYLRNPPQTVDRRRKNKTDGDEES
jgi:5-methylcytosine-specific restriction endonuclease McrA